MYNVIIKTFCKRSKIMNSLIRELYYSEICGANKHFEFAEEAGEAYKARQRLYESIAEQFNKDELSLFEKYVEETQIVRDEEIFHAYVSGMKDLLRLFASVFDEQ